MLSSSELLSPLSDVVKVALEEEQTHQEHTTHTHTHADIHPRVHLCPLLVAPRLGGQVVITPSYIPATRNHRLRDGKLRRCK